MIQHPNGTISGIYARVETVMRENNRPFGEQAEKVPSEMKKSHVTCTELDVDQSPWAEGAYHDRLLPGGTIKKVLFDNMQEPHYLRQHRNGTFSVIYGYPNKTPVPRGIVKEQVLDQEDASDSEVVDVDVKNTPWAAGRYIDDE